MRTILLKSLALFFAITSYTFAYGQCDPAAVTHYNMGDFPYTSSTGVTVDMGGTNSGILGPYSPYGCSPATCDANTVRMDPGDAAIFTFSQPVFELTFVSGVMNTYENAIITSNGASTPTLAANCAATETSITGNTYVQIGALASPVMTVTFPGGATEMTITCMPVTQGGGNGVFTIDMLDCIDATPNCVDSYSSITEIVCDSYTSPSGNMVTTSSVFNDTIPNALDCDSIITIDLTVNVSTSSSITETALDSYTAPSGAVYTTTGIYNDTITNAVGCDSVITIDLTMNYTGIDEYQNFNIDLHPNPTSKAITVTAPLELLGKNYIVLDALGRTILDGVITSNETILNLETFGNGVYLLKIVDTNLLRRIVKK